MSEKEIKKDKSKEIQHCPILPAGGFIIFPGDSKTFEVKQPKSIEAVKVASRTDKQIAIFMKKDAYGQVDSEDDLYVHGTLLSLYEVVDLRKDIKKIFVTGVQRITLKNFDDAAGTYLAGTVELHDEPVAEGKEFKKQKAMLGICKEVLDELAIYYPSVEEKISEGLEDDTTLGAALDLIASNLPMSERNKIEALKAVDVYERYNTVMDTMQEEIAVAEIRAEIEVEIEDDARLVHRENILRQQLTYIRSQLTANGALSEIDLYLDRVEKLNASDEIKEKLRTEINYLESLSASSSEGGMVRSYIDTMLDFPWDKASKDNNDIARARKTLDKNHYGMERVKERILEFLAVRSLTEDLGHAPIICLVGPPGTGKTTVARSVAEALNKNYQRISLGGVHDEAEIRGHRKTYVGAMMGQVAKALRRAEVKNPLILLDEIDKVGNDGRGDIFAALLEVLDPDQNNRFRDHYVDLPIDLSQVLFITTANSLAPIPRPLLDRMEVIELSGYTENEKFHIAKDHIVKKQIQMNGMNSQRISISDKAIKELIASYTRESGVRELERTVATVCRRAALQYLTKEEEGVAEKIKVTDKNLVEFLGKPLYSVNKANKKNEVGIARGLAWTAVGGVTLQIEVNTMPGKGEVGLTGHMGEIMQESAKIAYSYIRSVAAEYGIDQSIFTELDTHIHITEGAVPKDGPSAGITMATAMWSAFSKKEIDARVAMTGEITLRGKVLPVGGLKEKLLAAKAAGMKKVLIPVENQKDMEEISTEITEGMEIVYVTCMDEVLSHALINK